MEVLKIPNDRVAVLIGTKGEAMAKIEKRTGVKLNIDPEGEVQIKSKDAYKEFIAKEVVKAIGRGFSPDDALMLAEEEYYLKIIDLKDMLGTDKAIQRQRARIIGEGGRTKLIIEECSDARVSVYGTTVSFIGHTDEIELAADAVMGLLDGKPHSVVYALLEKGRRRMKEDRMVHMWEPAVER